MSTQRILVVNSNASRAATALIEDALLGYHLANLDTVVVTADRGPQGIDTALDLALAAVETVRVVVSRAGEFDAVVIACGNDPGLEACRQVTQRPVIGIAEAAFHASCLLGARFAVPVLGPDKIARMEDLARRYGLSDRLAAVVPLDMTTADALSGRERLRSSLIEAGRVARDRDRAETFALTGSAMAGLENDIEAELGIPVICGLAVAVRFASALSALGLRSSHAFSYRTVQKRDALLGYDELAAVYGTPVSERLPEGR